MAGSIRERGHLYISNSISVLYSPQVNFLGLWLWGRSSLEPLLAKQRESCYVRVSDWGCFYQNLPWRLSIFQPWTQTREAAHQWPTDMFYLAHKAVSQTILKTNFKKSELVPSFQKLWEFLENVYLQLLWNFRICGTSELTSPKSPLVSVPLASIVLDAEAKFCLDLAHLVCYYHLHDPSGHLILQLLPQTERLDSMAELGVDSRSSHNSSSPTKTNPTDTNAIGH